MKLIHCADLHLDSKLQTNLDRDRAKGRRDELLRNFARLADYAAENAVEAILISGDLFDRDEVSSLASNTVLSVIGNHPEIRFYYLRGNHDTGDCLRTGSGRALSALPGNLFLFDRSWKTWREGRSRKIAITGREQTGPAGTYGSLAPRLDPDCFNIVMLHGQTDGEKTLGEEVQAERWKAPADRIDLRVLRGKGIDYLALGHIHTFRTGALDSRGVWCYPGCLEARGFDESGPHGFVLLDIDEDRRAMRHQFIPFAQRILYRMDVDVTGCLTTAQMSDLVEAALDRAGCREQDMADVTLRGELEVEAEKDTDYLRNSLEARFFFARLTDATTLHIEIGDYLYDETLRGEFVRLVMADPSIPEEDRAAVIRCGFRAMDGQDPV